MKTDNETVTQLNISLLLQQECLKKYKAASEGFYYRMKVQLLSCDWGHHSLAFATLLDGKCIYFMAPCTDTLKK
jgi:hypothetical protein